MCIFKPNVKRMTKRKDVAGLIEALRNENMSVRRKAAEALGLLGDAQAYEPLIKALDDDHSIRWRTAIALGRLGDKRAVRPLIEALITWNTLEWSAAIALGELGDTQAVVPLIGVLLGGRAESVCFITYRN